MSDFLDEILELSEIPVITSNMITINSYIERANVSRSGAQQRLNHLVRDGMLETGLRKDPATNRTVRAWWKK